MENIVELKGVVMRFGDFVAVDGIDMAIKRGEIYGILGPNGAGKTTAINMMLGLLEQTSGKITISGLDTKKEINKIKMMIGFMTQETVVDQDLTAEENLEITGRLYHIEEGELRREIDGALMESDLEKFRKVRAGTFSGGMQRRLNLVRSMMHSPKILILDEPTTGLDVQNRVSMWKKIKELNEKGLTVILTTQYLEEADALCDRISIIDHGKIIAHGTPAELKRMVGSGDVLEISTKVDQVERICKMLKAKFKLDSVNASDKITCVIEKNATLTLSRISAELDKEKIQVNSIGLHLPTLDDVFIKLTGSTMRDTLGDNRKTIKMR